MATEVLAHEGEVPTSLVTRLVKAAALWTLPALLIASIGLTWLYRSTIYKSFDDPLESAATALIASVDVNADRSLSLLQEPIDPRYQRALSGRYWMIGRISADGDIVPLRASQSLLNEELPVSKRDRERLAAASGEVVRLESAGPNGNEPLRALARQVMLPGLDDPIVIMAAADRRPASRSVLQFALAAIGALLLLTGGLIAAIYAQVRVGLRPLFDLRESVASVREGRSDRVQGPFPSEIQPLATELNSLITHNRNVVERAQTHVGNLAHGLKTPLAVLRHEAELSGPVANDVVKRQTDAMAKQVDHHLRRARAAARGQSIGLSSDIDPVLDGLIRTLPRIYRDKDLQIDLQGETGLKFRGDSRDLEDIAGNLLDNAAKWSNGAVQITRHGHLDRVRLIIEDDGPGIAEDQRETALMRGARLDEQTPGSGLGLAIVGDLVTAYGGQLALSRSDLGGLRIDLDLPLSMA